MVRTFLGLAGYYRCFIPSFTSLACALTDLTKKGKPDKIQCSPAAKEAFQRLKAALSSSLVLHAPDFSWPFTLQTDASDTGLGAFLSQTIRGEEQPVTYISRKLTPPETWYAAVEKEALPIKWAILEQRYYLLGRSFMLAPSVDDQGKVHQWQSHQVVPSPSGFPFCGETSGWGLQCRWFVPDVLWLVGSGKGHSHPLPRQQFSLLSTGPAKEKNKRGRGCDELPAVAPGNTHKPAGEQSPSPADGIQSIF